VQDDVVQLVDGEQPVTAHGRIPGGDRLERPAAEIAREDDVDDVLGREALHRRDRVDDRDGPLHGDVLADAYLFGELPTKRVDEALA
jgi:hypothetical protein